MLSYLLVKYLAVEWLGHMARFMLTFVRNYHMVFQNDFTVLHSHQNCMEVLIFPHLCQPVGNPSFIFILAISLCGVIFSFLQQWFSKSKFFLLSLISYFSLLWITLGYHIWETTKIFFPIFYSRSFILLGFTYRSKIHIIKLIWGMKCFVKPFLHMNIKHHLLKRLHFLPWIAFTSLSKITCPYVCGLLLDSNLFHWLFVSLHVNPALYWILMLCKSWNKVICLPTLQICFGYSSFFAF